MAKTDPAIPLPEPRETYAFERSCGMTPTEACRRAAGERAVNNGSPTKWERMPSVQRRIRFHRMMGQTDEMLAAKRARLEERLQLAAFGNIFDFAILGSNGDPAICWDRVIESPYGVIVSSFKFDKDTGRLVDFDRDNAMQAIAQLRDMNGFKAPEKRDLTIHTATDQMTDDDLARIAAGGREGAPAASVDP
jgi:hypothetical protein